VTIEGSRFVMQKGRLMVCPGAVTLTVHPPMQTTGISREKAREFAESVRHVVMSPRDAPAAR
jgi:hypothetical protein